MAKESTLLNCDLARKGDARNRLIIRSSSLTIYHKGVKEDFLYSEIKSIGIGHKKLIIPLVMGGIGTSFSMLALSLGWYIYELNLLATFLFFLWMYYGFSGSDALVVDVKGHQHIFLLRSNKRVVQEAINFLKERMWKIKALDREKVYHIADHGNWYKQEESYYYSTDSLENEGFIHLSSEEDLKETIALHIEAEREIVLICINAKWLLGELRFEYVGSRRKSMPHLYAELNKSAVLWVVELKAGDLETKHLETFS